MENLGKNAQKLDHLFVSLAHAKNVKTNERLMIIGRGREMMFDHMQDLIPLD